MNPTQDGRPLTAGRTEQIALGVLVIGSLLLAYRMTRPLLLVVAAAAASASLLLGVFTSLLARFRGRSRLAATATVAGLLLCVLGPVGVLAAFGGRRIVVEVAALSSTLHSGNATLAERVLEHAGPLRPVAESALASIGKAAGFMPALAQAATRSLGLVGHAAVSVVVGLFLFAVALYYFLLRGGAWAARLMRLVPLPDDDVRLFFHRFRLTALGILVGNLGTAATQATVASIGYLVFGVPAPFLFGAATFVAALIPLVGPALVWLPLVAWTWISGHTAAAIGLFVYGLAVVSTVDNFVRPVLTRRGVPIHPLLLFLALFGGIASYGFSGVFWGPFVMVLAVTSVELWEELVARRG
ncbi:MAG: hypothetical protein JWM53_3376 [bacterium]|nr:hypothetical protein [bacterium]